MCLSQIYPTASVVSTTGCPNDDEVEKLSWIGFSNLKVSGNPGPHITSTTFSHWKKKERKKGNVGKKLVVVCTIAAAVMMMFFSTICLSFLSREIG